MLHHRANEGRSVDKDWHEFRQMALETSFSEEEWSDIERERYNLDKDDEFAPLNITGEQNPETYTGENTDRGHQDVSTDSRDLPHIA